MKSVFATCERAWWSGARRTTCRGAGCIGYRVHSCSTHVSLAERLVVRAHMNAQNAEAVLCRGCAAERQEDSDEH